MSLRNSRTVRNPNNTDKLSFRRVFVRDLILPFAIGVYAHEQEILQRVRINIDLFVPEENNAFTDNIENVVDYEGVVESVRKLAGGAHVKLVETLAEQIISACFYDVRVYRVRVRVEKLDIYDDADSVGVEIDRVRVI